MNDQALLELVRRADPLRGVGEPPSGLLERVLASPRAGRGSLFTVLPRVLFRSPRPRRRAVLLACAIVVAAAPLAALAAANHWWFLRADAYLPRPGQRPIVVKRGSWDGHRWTLVAYPSKHFVGVTKINGTQINGLCWGVTFSGRTPPHTYSNIFYGGTPNGADDGMACGSLVGIQKPKLVADLEQVGDPIPTAVAAWSLTSTRGYPNWISGVVVSSATHVVIRWAARKAQPGTLASPREVVRARTYAAAVKGYRVRLFAAVIPKALSRHTRTASVETLPETISGTDRHGRVVACSFAGAIYAPLSSCKP